MDAAEILEIIESEDYDGQRVYVYMGQSLVRIGIFVQGPDYEQLKQSNVWRFVQFNQIEEWNNTTALSCTDLILGKDIVRIGV